MFQNEYPWSKGLKPYYGKMHPIWSSGFVVIISYIFSGCPPDVPYLCKNKMSCYTDDQKCNLKLDCMDGSDETDDCGKG